MFSHGVIENFLIQSVFAKRDRARVEMVIEEWKGRNNNRPLHSSETPTVSPCLC